MAPFRFASAKVVLISIPAKFFCAFFGINVFLDSKTGAFAKKVAISLTYEEAVCSRHLCLKVRGEHCVSNLVCQMCFVR